MNPERFHRLRAVLDRRQPDLTVVFDDVHKPHNFSAILRSCDAVGVFEAHAAWPNPRMRIHGQTSGGAGKWVKVHTYSDVTDAIGQLKQRGFVVAAAHAGDQAVSYRDYDFCQPTAVVLGAELTGVTQPALEAADHHLVIPMHGHVESLNVSVANALILFEAQRQRETNPAYSNPGLPPAAYRETLFEWAHPKIAAYCQRHDVPYPPLDEDGQIADPDWRDRRLA